MKNRSDISKPYFYTGVNIVILILLCIFSIMTVLFPGGFTNLKSITTELILIAFLSLIFMTIIRFVKHDTLRAVLQTIFYFTFFSFFYSFTANFQLLVFDWKDAILIKSDTFFFGREVSLLMQNIVTPYLTEAMMFGYIMYFPLLIITALAVYVKTGGKGLNDYLFLLALGYGFCYVCFIFFPVAGMMNYSPHSYSVPLEGGLFTSLGELIRSKAHFPGGNFPSPHVTAGSIMLFVLFRYNRPVFYVVLPIIILLVISTVYCRYHYLCDGIAAMGAVFLIVKIAAFVKSRPGILSSLSISIINSPSISGSLTEN